MRRYPVKFRVVYFIVLLIFVFGALWLISDRNKSVAEYRSEIINLSRQYIKALANIQSIGPDDAYSAELTGYDLKKTLAVILDDTLRRVDEIELKLSNLTVITPDKSIKQSSEYHNPVSLVSHTLRGLKMRNNEELNYKTIDHLALLQDAQEKCVVDARDISLYPECFSKIEWLRSGWTNHQCYTELGVDGSECSFVRYLSEVENFCPPLDSRRFFKYRRKAEITRNLEGLLSLLASDQYHSVSKSFMRARLKRMWPDWLTGVQHYINGSTSQSSSADHCKHCSSANETCIARCRSTSFVGQPILFGRPKLNILLHLGFLTNGVGYSFESHIAKGGPLGELVQWTDLIAALYILGHNITITYEVAEAKLKLLNPYLDLVPCQVEGNKYDLVYTDIIGYKGMKKHKIRVPSCKFRILDTFGTEAAYNREEGTWGGLHLNLQQFYTFFPHTPDNSFLGFVTEAFSPKSKPGPQVSKPIALVYGKENYMWIGRTNYLKILSDYFELHGNVWGNNEDLPKFVHIHQLQYGQSYLQLLSKAQVMIGLGFPYEGPGPLEAIANGIIFLNPRFNPPHSRSNQKFFRDKPTSRSLTSQHPYIENYIGEPYSYLIDMENETQIRSTVEQLLTSITNEGYRPHEYTPWGFLERLNAYLIHQDICSTPFYYNMIQSPLPVVQVNKSSIFNYLDVPGASVSWPPASSLKIVVGSLGKSCVQTCMELHTPEPILTSSIDHSANSVVNTTEDQQIWTGYLYYRSVYATPPQNYSRLHALRCAPEHFPSVNHRLNLQYFGIFCSNVTYASSSVAPFWNMATNSCVFQADQQWFDCTASENDTGFQNFSRFCPCRDALPNQISICPNCL